VASELFKLCSAVEPVASPLPVAAVLLDGGAVTESPAVDPVVDFDGTVELAADTVGSDDAAALAELGAICESVEAAEPEPVLAVEVDGVVAVA
jgi:hypothetical protein